MKRTTLIVFLLLFVGCSKEQPIQSEMPTRQLDAIIEINTASKKIRFIDEQGKEVGSASFDDSIVLEIKRHKQ